MKQKQNHLARKMAKAGMDGGVGNIIRKGEWELSREVDIPGAPKSKTIQKTLALSKNAIMTMATDKAGGMSDEALAKKYSLSVGYVRLALQRLYVNSKIGREILKGVLLEGAIATGMRAHEKIKDLTGMQSVAATSLLTSRFIELDKHITNSPADIDWNELAEVGKDLSDLRKLINADDDKDKEPDVTDI